MPRQFAASSPPAPSVHGADGGAVAHGGCAGRGALTEVGSAAMALPSLMHQELPALPLSRIRAAELWDVAVGEPHRVPDFWQWQDMLAPKLLPPPSSPIDLLPTLEVNKLETRRVAGKELVRWRVDGNRLESHTERILSPEFQLRVGPEALSFRLVALAKETGGKNGAGFRKAKGQGSLELKCVSQVPAHAPDITVRTTIANHTAPTVRHSFVEKTCCPLPHGNLTDWDFKPDGDYIGCEVALEVDFSSNASRIQ